MKTSIFVFLALSAGAALAVPGTPVVTSVSEANGDGCVTVTYTLPGEEAAIVTMSATLGGVVREPVTLVGAVNSLVQPGTDLKIYWNARADLPADAYAANALSVALTAWSPSTPPDYMAVSLMRPAYVKYYASSNAVPGGVGDRRWKEDWMLLRRIPAKGVEWRMGCTVNDYCWNVSELESTGNGTWMPTHYVTSTADFYIGVYEVTQGQYRYLANGATPSGCGKDSFANLQNAPHRTVHETDWKWHPVEKVTWTMATNATETLATNSGLPFCLPTEEQWEFAARGETQWGTYNGSPHNPDHIKPIGVCYQTQEAYYGGKKENGFHPNYADHMPVGLLRPNKYGLYDMIGNAREWCSGWFDEANALRPLRGGSLHMSGEGHGAGYSNGRTANAVHEFIGFRVACAIP